MHFFSHSRSTAALSSFSEYIYVSQSRALATLEFLNWTHVVMANPLRCNLQLSLQRDDGVRMYSNEGKNITREEARD